MKCGQGRPRRLPGAFVPVVCLLESPRTTVAGDCTSGMPVPCRDQEPVCDVFGGVRSVAKMGGSDREAEQEGEKR